MQKIPLSQQGKNRNKYFALVDDEDFDFLNRYRWNTGESGYACAKVMDKQVRMHRLIMGNPKLEIDHKDGNRLNNQRANLRICTSQQNKFNKSKSLLNKSSQYKGVSFYKRDKSWVTQITINKRLIYLGYFPNERWAAMAYDIAAKDLFGEYAKLNF